MPLTDGEQDALDHAHGAGDAVVLAGVVRRQQREIEQLCDLATRAVLAVHIWHHPTPVGKQTYRDCQEQFCVQARALGLLTGDDAEREGADDA